MTTLTGIALILGMAIGIGLFGMLVALIGQTEGLNERKRKVKADREAMKRRNGNGYHRH